MDLGVSFMMIRWLVEYDMRYRRKIRTNAGFDGIRGRRSLELGNRAVSMVLDRALKGLVHARAFVQKDPWIESTCYARPMPQSGIQLGAGCRRQGGGFRRIPKKRENRGPRSAHQRGGGLAAGEQPIF